MEKLSRHCEQKRESPKNGIELLIKYEIAEKKKLKQENHF
jgi:hypothetical protein